MMYVKQIEISNKGGDDVLEKCDTYCAPPNEKGGNACAAYFIKNLLCKSVSCVGFASGSWLFRLAIVVTKMKIFTNFEYKCCFFKINVL
jgi:hypothetical protein